MILFNKRLLGRSPLRSRMHSTFWLFGGILTAGVVTAFAGLATLTQDGQPQGLAIVLPDAVPGDLNAQAFSALDGNWADWAKRTSEEVAKLYDNRDRTVEEDRELLGSLQRKLAVMKLALDDSRYRSIHVPLADLHSRLKRRVDMAEAALDTMTMDAAAARQKRMDSVKNGLVREAGDLTDYLNSIPNGGLWVKYLNIADIRKAANDPSASSSAMDTLESTETKLAGASSLSDERQREFFSRPPFKEFQGAIISYLNAAQAPQEAGDDQAKVDAALKELIGALETYSVELSDASAAEARNTFRELQKIAPDGGQKIASAMQPHYFNYNLRVAVSEGFLNKLMKDRRSERGQVVDYILGTNVYGYQDTYSDVGADLLPSNDGIRFAITLNGVVQSNTQGVRSEATIYTSGYHTFYATKQVDFDGNRFVTYPAQISVNANNTTTGANTSYSGSLFEGVARSTAMRAAQRKEGESEAIAAGRVRGRVAPRLDEETNARFADANASYQQKVVEPLKELGLYPNAASYRSTANEARISTRLMDEKELGGGTPQSISPPPNAATVFVHETLLNNGVDRMDFAGKEMTDDEVRAKIEDFFTKLLGRKLELPGTRVEDEPSDGDDEGPRAYVFDETDPIRLHVNSDGLSLVLRTGFKQEGKEDIPTKEITVPLIISLEDDVIVIERGRVRVASIGRPASVAQGIAHSGVIRKKIQSAISTRRMDRKITIKQDGRPDVDLQVADVSTGDGWLAVTVD